MATVITARCTLDQHLPPLVSVLALARPPTTKNFPAVFQSFLIFFKNSWKTKNLGSKELGLSPKRYAGTLLTIFCFCMYHRSALSSLKSHFQAIFTVEYLHISQPRANLSKQNCFFSTF